MGAMPILDVRAAHYDRFREAVIIPAGRVEIAIVHSALEDWVNRRLTPDEAVVAAIDEKALIARVANSISAHDDVITITASILNSRSWVLKENDGEDE
ncbi:hypothetical protein ACFQ14_16185 [Pseudahrensia aquimaris]|uniref:Uncharacterized protein n=1 Tax=Pseudahrensia aquimaris TaxID=744461 RepID=A0ABW3FLR3_9HYPH